MPGLTGAQDGDDVDAELAALAARYETDRLRWQLAVAAGGVGSFDWDLVSGRLEWDDQLLEIFGIAREDFAGTIEAFDAALHPDDLDRVNEAIGVAVETCGQYLAEYRVVRPDGRQRWVRARGVALAGADGRAVRLLGAAYDTTSERDSDARIQRVLETMPSAFFLLDADWRFVYVNSAAARMLDRPREALLGGIVWELFPDAVGTMFEESYRGAVADGEPRRFEEYYPAPLDRWYEVRAWPGPDGLSVYFNDVTDRRAAQDEARAARDAAEASSRRLALLADLGDDLTSTLDTHDAVARLARHLVPAFGTWCLVTMSEDQRHLRDLASWHVDPRLRATVTRYAELRMDALAPSSYLFRALRTGETVAVPDATEAIARVLTGDARDLLRDLAPRMAYAVPMRARGRTLGAITVFLDDGPDLGTEDLTLLTQLADRAGMALDNARLYERQREIAVGLQRSLLSAPAQPDDLEVVVRYVAASEAAQVGGDWYDAFVQPSGSTVLAIGDVMGHDTPAAAAMSQLRTLLRGIAHTTDGTPAQILRGLDSAAEALHVGAMATAVVARLEQCDRQRSAATTTVRWTNAGHLPPLLVLPDGTVEQLVAPRPELVLGLDVAATRTDSEREVPRGSVLLLYTDGLVERRGEHLERGIGRLLAAVGEAWREACAGADGRPRPGTDGTSPAVGSIDVAALVDGVLARCVGDREPADDIAVLAVHLGPQHPA
ncbi:SpoIIE family protein phosphatase [Cellulomonas sp. DKR-3]|uniref:SpoIIE family protein phosphatase n=1 Tax=Cellulomonas fulva TaxID=2835530 RepID=A0ABS5U0P4_9CELL|nr:SpoIIE family protein phosphatase [Cellulomonas fulva]